MAAEVADHALDHERRDARSRQQVDGGTPISRAYPLDAEWLAEFRRQQGGGS